MRWILVVFMFTSVQGSDLNFPDENPGRLQHNLETRVATLEKSTELDTYLKRANHELEQRNLVLRRNVWYLERIAGFCAYFCIALIILRWLEGGWGKE